MWGPWPAPGVVAMRRAGPLSGPAVPAALTGVSIADGRRPGRMVAQRPPGDRRAVAAKPSILTLEQALALSGRDGAAAYAAHVNPEQAAWLRLLAMDRRYRRAEGIALHGEDGRAVLDFASAALPLGHNPPEVLQALAAARGEPAAARGYPHLASVLAANLSGLLPGALAVTAFGSGGDEALEHALKLARAATRRPRLLSCEGAFHGLSYGALSVSCARHYRAVVGPVLAHCERVPPGDVPALERCLRSREVAVFLVEPVQLEAGVLAPPPGYLAEAAALCRRYGTALVLDERNTGLGRTGRLFALEHEGVEPDAVVLGEALAAGVTPISACVASESLWRRALASRDRCRLLDSALGGHAAGAAAALKTLEVVLREQLWTQAEELGRHALQRLQERLAPHALVKAVRGSGLLLGVELAPPAMPGAQLEQNLGAMVASRLAQEHGILLAPCELAPCVLRLTPPLTVTRAQLDQAVEALEAVLRRGLTGLMMALGSDWVGRAWLGR